MSSAHQPAATSSVGSAPSLLTARLLVLAAAVMWSSGGFFAKFHAIDEWPGPLRAFWRAAFACVILLPLIRKPQWSWKLIPATLIFAAMNYTYLTAMAKGDRRQRHLAAKHGSDVGAAGGGAGFS